MTSVSESVNLLLWKAIEERRLIRFQYKEKERIAEPHDYGIQNGCARLFVYQVAGASSHKLPAWRLMDEDQISGIQLLEKRFSGGRPTAYGKHLKWDKLFIRVKPAEKSYKA